MKLGLKRNKMLAKYYKAIVTEKTAPTFGQIFATTKNGQYKDLSYTDFLQAIKNVQVFTFEIVEL